MDIDFTIKEDEWPSQKISSAISIDFSEQHVEDTAVQSPDETILKLSYHFPNNLMT